MQDEVIRLILDMGQSGKTVDDVRARLDTLGASTKKAADAYEVLDTVINRSVGVVGTYQVATDRANVALDAQVRAAMEATQAQQAMGRILDEMGTHTAVAAAGVDSLKGKGGKGGHGLMGASYAAQDFITVVSMGGGWGRAMFSMANNITPVLANLGVGMGLAGAIGLVVTAASTGVSALESWWKAADSDKADAAKEKLQEIEEQVKRTNAEFDKLSKAPTHYEKQSADAIRDVLSKRPNAEAAGRAVAANLTNKDIWDRVDQRAYREAEHTATESDRSIDARAYAEAHEALGADAVPSAISGMARELAAGARRRRADAQRKKEELLRAAREQKAKEIVSQATVAGPDGAKARLRLIEATSGQPGFRGIERLSPEMIEADEAAAVAQEEADEANAAPGSEAFAEKARRGVRGRRQAGRERERRAARDLHAMDAYLEQIGGDARQKLAKDDRARKAERLQREHEAARDAREHRPERLAGEIHRATGLDLSPEAAAHLVGPRDHPSAGDLDQAHLARRIQGQVFEGTGQRIGGDRALEAAHRLIEENNRAQAEAAQAFMGALNGMGRNTQVWQGMTAMIHRQMEQSPMPSGLPR